MYRRLLEAVRLGIFIADLRGYLIYINPMLVEILGFSSKADVIGKNIIEVLCPDMEHQEILTRELETIGGAQDYGLTYMTRKGERKTLSVTGHFVRNDRGHVIGLEGAITDISEKFQLERALKDEKDKLEAILSFGEGLSRIHDLQAVLERSVGEITRILHAQKCSVMLLNAESQMLEMEHASGIHDSGDPVRVPVGEKMCGRVAQDHQPLLVRNIEYDTRFQRANHADYLNRSFMIVPVISQDQELLGVINVADKMTQPFREESFDDVDLKVLTAMSRDIAVAIENVRLLTKLNLLSTTDPLTNIYNFRQFSDSLDHEIKRLERQPSDLTLIMLDVDNFKEYNDTYGHIEGDILLRKLSEIFRSHLRKSDIVCRYAGDEFVIILPDTNSSGARVAAEKILNAVRSYTFKKKVTLSMGVAEYEQGLTQQDFIARADAALYHSKKQGRDRVTIFKHSMLSTSSVQSGTSGI